MQEEEFRKEIVMSVFDFITLIKWMHSAVMQRPYSGWM